MGMLMSGGSQLPIRTLRSDERDLLQALLSEVYTSQEIDRRLSGALVQQMPDGGMGGIRFVESNSTNRRFGREAAAADYVDKDGTLVDISVNLDQAGHLLEVDFWKVDFSPLLRYPKPQDLRPRDLSRKVLRGSEPAIVS
jgi:hypothetical protein